MALLLGFTLFQTFLRSLTGARMFSTKSNVIHTRCFVIVNIALLKDRFFKRWRLPGFAQFLNVIFIFSVSLGLHMHSSMCPNEFLKSNYPLSKNKLVIKSLPYWDSESLLTYLHTGVDGPQNDNSTSQVCCLERNFFSRPNDFQFRP